MLPFYINNTTLTAVAINIILMTLFYSLSPALTILAPIAVMLGYTIRCSRAPLYYTGELGTLMFLQIIIVMICCLLELAPL